MALLFFGVVGMSGASAEGEMKHTYESLRDAGIVSGFGRKSGDPLALLDRIPPVHEPRYVALREGLYKPGERCIGARTSAGWRFAPQAALNNREIVNHANGPALCFCPLAGLSVAVPGKMHVSGLLRYDTFVLLRGRDKKLVLPFTQETVRQGSPVPLREVQMLDYAGVLREFPNAKILDPKRYRLNPDAYRKYPSNRKQGLGHGKPGLERAYDEKTYGFHPKEMVLLVGFDEQVAKIYPFAALEERLGKDGGVFRDKIGGKVVKVHYDPSVRWVRAVDAKGKSLNLGYAYIFAAVQHLPDLPVFR